MPKVQSRLSRVGLAKQASLDTAESSPTYEFGVTGGSVLSPEVSESNLNPTSDNRVVDGRERTGIIPAASFDAKGVPQALGLLALGTLGAVSTTDNGDGTYTHVFTPADSVPYLTTFAKMDGNYYRVRGAKVAELGLSFEGPGSINMNASLQGVDMNFDGSSSWTAGTTEGVDNLLRAAGGSFDVDGATVSVTQGELAISTGLTPVPSATKITPEELWAGIINPTVSLTLQPDDLALFREVLTGTPSGSNLSPDVKFGALNMDFTAPDGTTTLNISAPRMAFLVTFPEASPEGGPASLPLEGVVVQPTDGSDPLTITLTNSVTSY